MDWSRHLAHRTERIQPSAIREILKLTQTPGVISFAGGLPAPALFPTEMLAATTADVLAERGAQALQYSTTEGHPPLRAWVASQLPGAEPDGVQIVSGSQQGLDLVGKVLLDPGDKVVVAAPTYMGALRAFDPYQVDYLSVPLDEEGMLPDALEAALRQDPKLLYVIPAFDNPSGITTSLRRRRQLLELATRYDVPVFEDNPYGDLRFEGETLPSLFELAPDRVIHANTFSKIVVPGLRLAWLVASPELLTIIARAKQAADLHTATLTQLVAYEILASDFLPGQIARVQAYYRQQRDLMLAALERSMPEGCSWTRPSGGMFIWVTLPDGLDSTQLLREAVARRVAYVPGEPFFANGGGDNTLRLSYSVATREQIDAGIASLGEVVRSARAPA